MIEINLSPSAKKTFVQSGAKINLREMNLPLLVFALALSFVPDYLKTNIWDAEIATITAQVKDLSQENKSYASKIAEAKKLQVELDKFRKEEQELMNYLKVVQEIVNARKNPLSILKYVSNNLPQDLWLNTVKIENNSFEITGESFSYKSIGLFIEALKSSIFFAPDLRLQSSKTVQDQAGQRRVESFSIKATISRYE